MTVVLLIQAATSVCLTSERRFKEERATELFLFIFYFKIKPTLSLSICCPFKCSRPVLTLASFYPSELNG